MQHPQEAYQERARKAKDEEESAKYDAEFNRKEELMSHNTKYRYLIVFSSLIFTYIIFKLVHAFGYTITSYLTIITSIASATMSEAYLHYKSLDYDGDGHCKLFIKYFFISYGILIGACTIIILIFHWIF